MGIDGPEAVGSKFNMPDINVDTDYFLNVSFFIFILLHHCLTLPKAVIRRCFTKMVFLKISQNSQESTLSLQLFWKKRLRYRCFSVSFSKFKRGTSLRTTPSKCFRSLFWNKYCRTEIRILHIIVSNRSSWCFENLNKFSENICSGDLIH